MVNIDDFIKRLEIILDYYSLNASSFADKIGVQRSSMSHLLSGRNKPSLDFVMKILEVFPEVDLYWVLNGTGNFPKREEQNLSYLKDSSSEMIKTTPPISSNENLITPDLFSKINYDSEQKIPLEENDEIKKTSENQNQNSEIEKIVFFYKNCTFKIYHP